MSLTGEILYIFAAEMRFLSQAGKPAVWKLKTEEFPKVPLSQEPEEEPSAGKEGKGREGG